MAVDGDMRYEIWFMSWETDADGMIDVEGVMRIVRRRLKGSLGG